MELKICAPRHISNGAESGREIAAKQSPKLVRE
jgi:hypothetical protein